MIVVSGALVLVALGLLVMGVLGRDLPLVYGSIAVSTLSLLCLLVGILQRRGEPVPQDGDELVPVHVPATSGVTGSETVAERQDAAAHTSTLSHDLLSRGRADDEESGSADGDAQEQGWEGGLTDDPQDDDGDEHARYEDDDEPPQEGVRLVRVPQHLPEPEPEDGELDEDGDEGARRAGTVLVVPGRPRYHVEGCRYLYGKHPQGLDVADARDSGFVPCGVCKPDESLAADGDPLEDTADEAQEVEPLHEEPRHEPEQDGQEQEQDELSLEESLFGEAVFGGPAQERDVTRELPLVEAAEPQGAPQGVPDVPSGTSDADLAEREPDETDAAASTSDPAPEQSLAEQEQEQEQAPAMTASGAPDDDPADPASESPAEQSPEELPPASAPLQEPPVLEAAVTKASATKAPAKRAPAKRAPARKAPVRKASAERASAKRAPATKAPAQKAPAKKAPATEAAADAAAPDGPPAAPAPAPSGPAVRRIRAVGAVTPRAPGAAPTVRRISATGARRPSPTTAPAPAPPGASRTAMPARRTGQVVVVPDRPRFHLAQCRFVRDVLGATSLSRAAADRQGYVPCGVCKP